MRSRLPTAAARLLALACALTACSDSQTQADTSASVTGTEPRAAGVAITVMPARDTIGFGAVTLLGAQGLDANGRTVHDEAVVWRSSDSTIATIGDAGILLAGRREGRIVVTARMGALEGRHTFVVRARASRSAAADTSQASIDDAPTSWTFCASAGSTCEYLGLRAVRLVLAGGATLQHTAFGRVACTADAFGGQGAQTGRALRCEYGPMQRRTLVNPMPGTFGMETRTIVPVGSAGAGGEQIRPIGVSPRTSDGSGSFRTQCELVAFQFNDPLGNPRRASVSPLHAFFGNTRSDQNTTSGTVARSGNSTCRGGAADRSLYYLPAVIDSRNGDVQVPADIVMYFRTGHNMEPVTIQPIPDGLVMVAGDRNARGLRSRAVEWLCRDKFVTNSGMIPDCGVGDQVQLWIHFPQCWNGRALDSRDHRSHMAYAELRSGTERSSCPPSHPVALPQLSEVVQYTVRPGASLATWRLSTDAYGTGLRGGLSAHAHWINGWNPRVLRTMVSECLNRAVDCNTSSLGNGTALF